MSAPLVVLTGGGTAGHVLPNLVLADALRARGLRLAYIGSPRGVEAQLVAEAGVAFHGIPAGKLRRYFSLANVTDVFRVLAGIVAAWRVLGRLAPQVVFSKGGFVAFPVVLAAWLRRIPVIAHESDVTPGLANRLSYPFVREVLVTFRESVSRVGAERARHVGLPLRPSVMHGDGAAGARLAGFDARDERPVVLVMGGSLGSEAINAAIRDALDVLLARWRIVHLTGRDRLREDLVRPGYAQFEFVNAQLGDLLALADMVIARAGATSLYELLALRKPHLLIPLPLTASRGDQLANAALFEGLGCSRVLTEDALSADTLVTALDALHAERARRVAAMARYDVGDATAEIADTLLALAHT